MTIKRNAGPGGCQVPAKFQISINGAILVCVPAKFKAEAVPTNKDGIDHELPTFTP